MKTSPLCWSIPSFLVALVLLPISAGRAQILTQYTFATYTTNTGDSPATTTASGVTATDYLANAAGFTGFSANSTASNYAFNTAGNDGGTDKAIGSQSTTVPNSEALSVTDNTYFSFTLTPGAGSALDLTSLSFFLRTRVNTGGTASYTANVAVRTSLDNYTADVGTATGTEATVGANTGYVANSFSLTGLGVNGLLGAQTPVTFRFYVFDNQSVSADDQTIDTVTVNGTLVIPEPSTVAALGVGLAALVATRRRLG